MHSKFVELVFYLTWKNYCYSKYLYRDVLHFNVHVQVNHGAKKTKCKISVLQHHDCIEMTNPLQWTNHELPAVIQQSICSDPT